MLRVNSMPAGLALIFVVLAKPLPLQAANLSYSCIQFIQNSIDEEAFHPSNENLSETDRISQGVLSPDEDSSEGKTTFIALNDFLEKLKNGQLNGQVWQQATEKTKDQTGDQIGKEPGNQIGKEPGNQTGKETGDQIGQQATEKTKDQTGKETGDQTGDFEPPSPTTTLRDPSTSSSQPSESLSSAIATATATTVGEVASPPQPPNGLIEPPGRAILRELSGSSPSQMLELLSKLYSIDYSFSEQTKLMAKFMDEIMNKLDEFNKSQLMEIIFWLDSLDMDFNEKFIREWRKSAQAIRRQFSSLDRYWLYSIFRKQGISPEEAQVSITY